MSETNEYRGTQNLRRLCAEGLVMNFLLNIWLNVIRHELLIKSMWLRLVQSRI